MEAVGYVDNYYDTLEHEIFFSVYYYHNKLGNIDLHTIGCELSEWDGERIVETIGKDTDEEVIVFNTCAVTNDAQRASEKVVQRLKLLYPDKKMYICGCGVNYNKEYYEKYGICLSNEEKFDKKSYDNVKGKHLDKDFKHNIQNIRGLIKIQDGCHNKCAYCAINLLRSHPYSLPYEDIKKQVEELLKENKTAINLIGTEICTYNDNGLQVVELCRKLLQEYPQITEISMGALDPASPLVDDLIELIKSDDRMCKTVYLSTQSCSNTILKLMNRRHTYERMKEIVDKADGKVFFSWHVIVGFPGETDELFNETIEAMKVLKPVGVDVMPFSKRKGTLAYDMVQNTPDDVIHQRLLKVYKTLDEINEGTSVPVSIESLEAREFGTLVSRNQFYPTEVIKEDNKVIDLYDINEFTRIYKGLENKTITDGTIITLYDKNKNQDDLETNIKMLVFNFGVKVLTNINLTNEFMADVLADRFNIRDFIVYSNTYIRLLPSNDTLDSDLLVKFIVKLKKDQLYQMNIFKHDFKNHNEIISLIDILEEI